MMVAWVNSSSPSWPISAPIPACLAPANGVSGLVSRCLFLDRPGIDPGRHVERAVAVRRPDRAAQAEFRVVGTCDHLVEIGIAQHRQHRAELLLANQPGVVGDVAHDGRLDEIAVALEHPAAGNDLAVLPGVLQEPFHLLELRLVLDRADLRAWLQPVADDRLSREPAQLVADGVADRIVDVEPWYGG